MANGLDEASESWMSDVQRALALILVGTFAISLLVLTGRLVLWGDAPTLVDLVKTLISALINVVMLVLGYFYGSSKAKEQSDTSQQRVVEKLTSPPPAGPVAPVASPTLPSTVPWWGKMTDVERAAVTAAAAGDPRIMTFVTVANVGAASADDLAYLVTLDLLTQERADAIRLA